MINSSQGYCATVSTAACKMSRASIVYAWLNARTNLSLNLLHRESEDLNEEQMTDYLLGAHHLRVSNQGLAYGLRSGLWSFVMLGGEKASTSWRIVDFLNALAWAQNECKDSRESGANGVLNMLDIVKTTELVRRCIVLLGTGLHGCDGMNPITAAHIVNIYVIPRLIYGSETWCKATRHLDFIKKFHDQTFKIIQGLPTRTANVGALILLGCLPSIARIHKASLALLWNAIQTQESYLYVVLFSKSTWQRSLVHGLMRLGHFSHANSSTPWVNFFNSCHPKVNGSLW